MKLKQQLIANTVFSILGLGFSRIIGFILTPYILYRLGIERYAIWSIMASILGYLTRADMGVATSYAKFISQFHPKKDYESINKVLNTGFVYYAVFGGILYTLAHFGGSWLCDLFRIDESMRTEVILLFRYVVLIRVTSVAFSVFRSVLQGVQRTDLVEKIRMVLFVVNALCTVTFLELGYRLGGLVLTNAVVITLKAVLFIMFAYKLVPELRFNPLLFDVPMFRKMFKYGLHLQMSRTAKIGQAHLSKLFVAYFLPLSAVAIYDIGNRIALSVRSIPSALSPSIIPAASQLHALKDTDVLNRLYDRASKYMAILVMYISGFFFCMMPVVILSWLGEQIDVGSVSTVARILLFGYAYYLLSDIASVVVLGMGHPEYLMRASVLKLLIVIALNVILIPNMGVIGAALAMTISEIIGTVYFVVPCHRELHRSYLGVIAQIYAWPIITSIFASLSTFVVYKLVYSFLFVPQGRLQNIGMILVTGIIFTSLYGLTLLKSAYIDTYDKGLFSQYLQKSIQYCGVLKRRKPLDASYPE